MSDQSKYVNQKLLSEHLDLTRQRITQIVDSGIFENGIFGSGHNKKYDLDFCRVAYIKMLRDASRIRASKNEKYDEAKTRLTIAQADKTELEVAASKRQLIPIDDMELVLSALMIELKTHFQNLPGKLRSRLPKISAKDHKYIQLQVAEFLNSCSDDIIDKIVKRFPSENN